MRKSSASFLLPASTKRGYRNIYANIPAYKIRVIDNKIKSMSMSEKRKALLVIDACLLGSGRISTYKPTGRIKLDSLRELVQESILKELRLH